MKKSKLSKKTLLIILIAFITYFAGGDKYVKFVANQLQALVAEETPAPKSEDKEGYMQGTVTHVSDGDTATLTSDDGTKHKIRLNGIDAPETGQSYGEESKNFVKQLALNKKASVQVIGTDQYNRVLGVLYVEETNVNEALLANGLAWQYRFNKDLRYQQLADKAKTENLNIWSDTNALDPYVWRKQNRK